ncbi:MAG: serine/threonine-protein kinase, partial [Planctomycetota bacterium]|nr:serine/threonine-protein kinase [Planctomycetota bacterium]
MNRDEYQGHQLITLGWATQDLVNQAWHSPRQPHQDICEVLLAWGRISPEQAAHIRQGSQQQSQSGQSSSSGSSHSSQSSASSGFMGIPQTVSGSQGLELKRSQERDWSLGVGPYTVVREISRGGMGIVFEAKHRQSGQDVALKVMLSAEASETDRARFDREAKALQGFTHPNIVRFYDAGVDGEGNEPYFAMELVKGRDLKEVIESHKKAHGAMPDLPWMLRVLKPIASALARCHSKQIIHRDLKPQNILIEEKTQRPVLVDFGLVKRSKTADGENFEHSLTKAGDVLGTPAYMAPEQLDPEEFGKPDHATDTWGFGGILLYCLTGQAPYKGSTNFNIYKKVMTESPPRVRSLNKDVPPWLDELCAQCFQRDRKLRPSMEQVVEDLDRDPQDFTGGQSSKTFAIVAVIAILCCVGIAAFLYLSKPSTALSAISPQSIVYTKASSIELEIQTESELDLVIERLENDQWTLDPAGDSVKKSSLIQYFQAQLKEGENLFRVFPRDDQKSAVQFEIRCDRTAPTVQFTRRCKFWKDVIYFEKSGAIKGQIKDESPVTLKIQGAEILVIDGEFQATLSKPETLGSITVAIND